MVWFFTLKVLLSFAFVAVLLIDIFSFPLHDFFSFSVGVQPAVRIDLAAAPGCHLHHRFSV